MDTLPSPSLFLYSISIDTLHFIFVLQVIFNVGVYLTLKDSLVLQAVDVPTLFFSPNPLFLELQTAFSALLCCTQNTTFWVNIYIKASLLFKQHNVVVAML